MRILEFSLYVYEKYECGFELDKRCHYLSQHISATESDTNTKQWNR